MGGTTIYHTGDSDLVPEMENLRPDILLVPVSGTYVMTASEAARAVGAIRPKVAIPMHYGSIVGNERDAKEFSEAVRGLQGARALKGILEATINIQVNHDLQGRDTGTLNSSHIEKFRNNRKGNPKA